MLSQEFWPRFLQALLKNKGIIGGILGFGLSILILTIGFFKTLIIVFFTLSGYLLGSRFDLEMGKNFKKVLDRILPPKLH